MTVLISLSRIDFPKVQMGKHNRTVLSEFILMGITDHPELQAPLLGLFLIIYMISVMGNLGMVILTKRGSGLQTPMYFFLRHPALTDLGYSTTTVPKILANFVADQNKISYYFCTVQLAFFLLLIIHELVILEAMPYDCHPLVHPVTISQRVCWVLVATPYFYCTFVSLLVTVKIFNLSSVATTSSNISIVSLPLISLLCSNTREIQ